MNIAKVPFQVFDLEKQTNVEHEGLTGTSLWKTIDRGNIRIRTVEYAPGYSADHWCEKGHAVYVLEGEFEAELMSGEKFTLSKGMGFLVGDKEGSHRTHSRNGVKLMIAD